MEEITRLQFFGLLAAVAGAPACVAAGGDVAPLSYWLMRFDFRDTGVTAYNLARSDAERDMLAEPWRGKNVGVEAIQLDETGVTGAPWYKNLEPAAATLDVRPIRLL